MDNSQKGPLKPLTFAKMSVRIIKKNLRKSFVFFQDCSLFKSFNYGKAVCPVVSDCPAYAFETKDQWVIIAGRYCRVRFEQVFLLLLRGM